MENVLLTGSYLEKDVVFLLKEITGFIVEKNNEFREKAIQSGVHYSEMLPIEYHPTEEYMNIFYKTLEETKGKIATLIGIVGDIIIKNRGKDIVLVSLARAGTPIGILIKRYLQIQYGVNVPHYSISIIRDKGIDQNALFYILKNHPNLDLQFIDGWTGKGVIQNTLIEACEDFYKVHGIKLNPDLAVLADPAYCASTYGTREDFLIPSACLNATVSGLMSRTVYNEKFISKEDFHGAKYYKEWKDSDVSNYFIDSVTAEFQYKKEVNSEFARSAPTYKGAEDVAKIQKLFKIDNINLIKPGVGETTRVLLRRIPWKILVDDLENPNLKHILRLAEDRNIPIEVYTDMSYSCCGIIKSKECSDV